MKYVLHLNACVTEAVSIAEKHSKLVVGLASVPGPWGLASAEHPAPDPGRELSAQFQMGKSLRGRGARGFVSYRFRGGLRDDSGCDDLIDLDFNTARVDFGALVQELPKYIAAFDPYFVYLAAEEFGFFDFNRSRNANYRVSLLRVYPICYLSSNLCSRALGLSLREFASRLAHKAQSILVLSDGVLVVGHAEPIPFASARSLSDELSGLVGLITST